MKFFKRVFPPLVLTIAVALVFHNSLFTFFTQDDFAWLRIALNFVDTSSLLKIFFHYNGAGTYRPLTQELFFFVNYKMFGLNPVAFHLVSLSVHIFNSLLVYAVLRELRYRPFACLAGALFYGVNSSLFISVYWISAITESGMAMFYLLSVLFFIRFLRDKGSFNYVLSFAMFIGALMSKESAITIPAIFILIHFYLKDKVTIREFNKAILPVLPFAAVVFIYLGVRFTTIGVPNGGPYQAALNALTFTNFLKYLGWGFNDFHVSLAAMGEIIGNNYLGYFRVVLIVLFSAGLLLLLLQQRKTLMFASLWFVVALLPVLPFIYHAQNYYVNIPIVGISILVAAIVNDHAQQKKIVVSFLLSLYVLISINNVHFLENSSWVCRRAKLARTALKDVQSLFPRLQGKTVLYILNADDDDYWAYSSSGDLFKIYYGNNELTTLFEGKSKLPDDFERMNDFHALFQWEGHLYDVTSRLRELRDVSKIYRERYEIVPVKVSDYSSIIDFGKKVAEGQLTKGWYKPANGSCWMAKDAEILLRNPKDGSKRSYHLAIKGSAVLDYYPAQQVEMVLKSGDDIIGKKVIQKNGDYSAQFDFQKTLPRLIPLSIELSNSFVPNKTIGNGDTRELGIIVRSIELL
jgi:hypothetical protein